jgi:hypothetical protein
MNEQHTQRRTAAGALAARGRWILALALAALATAGCVSASRPVALAPTPPAGLCGSSPIVPQIAPTLPAGDFPQSDAAVDCFMWQTFIYLNWPAQSPGQPDPAAQFGSAKPVVWGTYKPYDQVFLPDAQTPQPWATTPLTDTRVLTQTSKIGQATANALAATLTITDEAFAGPLVDQAGQLTYYEILLNEIEFNYIVANRLYDADAQYAMAEASGIALPDDSIEIKAAWKILTPSERAVRPLRFYTIQAQLGGSSEPTTMGLVGLHIMRRVARAGQGFWATFGQIDNAPLQGAPATGAYSYYNPNCAACPANSQTIPPTPTQIEQVLAIPTEAAQVNRYVQQLIAANDPESPWQFYQLLNAQWPQFVLAIGKPGATIPLPKGNLNTYAMLNPVLETFIQSPSSSAPRSCITCHANAPAAPIASNQHPTLATSFSFLFQHATSASR